MSERSLTSRESSIGKIEKVDPSNTTFHQTTGNKWLPVIKAFNPLGPIAEAYANTLAYKIEAKRLEVELARINNQTEIAKEVIGKTFQLKLEELTQRRAALVSFYQTVNAELSRLHIERVKVLEMAQKAQEKSFESGLPMEEKKLFSEMSIEMTKELPRFGEKSNESLKNLVSALPPVTISQTLLEGQ